MPGRLSPGEREYLRPSLISSAPSRRTSEPRGKLPTPGARRAGVRRPAPRRTAPALRGERVKLADGAEIVIRPIEPEDLNELAIGFGGLGALSRFRRFRQRIDRLTYEQLVALTDIDHESHEALVAIDAATGEGVGVARYVRVPDDPARAEVACTVVDPWQHRGVGSALAERLAARAGAAGIERCTALVVLGDQPARRLLAHVVDEIAVRRDGGTLDITAQARRAAP